MYVNAFPFVNGICVEEEEASGVNPVRACFEREGTTVRVECVSRLSRDELEDKEGEGDAVLEDDALGVSIGGGLGILRAASISSCRSSSRLDNKRCNEAMTVRQLVGDADEVPRTCRI